MNVRFVANYGLNLVYGYLRSQSVISDVKQMQDTPKGLYSSIFSTLYT